MVALVSNQRDEHPSPAEAPTFDVASAETSGSTQDGGDSFDEILKQVVQTRTPDKLEVGGDLLGRFKITGVLGEGGMGTVYMARDATLGREVAIKVHHAAGGARRLRREAVAMAKLAHPNVVTVFEVGDLAGRPFVVMEYITGTTLRAWLAAEPRSVREILALLVAAGEGLAAAHDAGLIHRDIKPENVLVGADGRARVGDFGLARELDSRDDVFAHAASPSAEDLHTPVTQTGAVLGTPAYMSPEQFAGAPVDARADQFAFCITAWEALWGERPFAGATFAQLHTAIATGARRAPPASPKVPARVRLALERGLATVPADRFPSLHALLDAMRPRERRYRRPLLGAGAIVLAGLTAVIAMRGSERSCDDAGVAELAAIRTDLPRLLAQHGASQIALRALAIQQRYAVSFRSHARTACEAGRAHEWSPDVVAKSAACFAVGARSAALALARLDPDKPMDVLRHLRRLPPEDQCRNQTYLASRPPIPSDPKQLDALIEAHATLAVGFDSVLDHDFVGLRAALARLEQSPAHADPGVAAGMTILRGWVAYDSGKAAETRKLFVDAYYAGRAIDDEQISSVALCQLIDHSDELGLDRATVEEWLRTALADADRVRVRSPWLAGQVYSIAAHAANAAADAENARVFVARAREVLQPGTEAWIDTFATEGAMLMWSGHVDAGIQAYDAAVAQRIGYAGADDPEVAQLLASYASSLLEVQRLEPALDKVERATQIIDHVADPNDERVDHIRVNMAAALLGANLDDEAYGLLITAREHDVRRLGETNAIIANIDSNLAVIYNDRGEHDRAIAALRSALAIQEKLNGPEHVAVAAVLYNLAVSYRYKHEFGAALEAIARAAKIHGARSPGSDRHRNELTMIASIANEAGDHQRALDATAVVLAFTKPAETPQTPAWAELERATALIALHRGVEARPLLVKARGEYDGLHMTKRVEQIDAMLARLPR
jgi:eukaryotic-like serine/threonine-protein kinase